MKIKILGLFGSPRRGGNTDLLLEEVLKGAQSQGAEIERIFLSQLNISPCQECRKCEIFGNCVINDEMQDIYPKLTKANFIILASPIFFYNVTAQTKILIDRCQALWARKYILKQRPLNKETLNRKGWFISVGATKGDNLFKGVILTVKYFFDAVDVEYSGELLFRKIDEKEAIKKHSTALKEAFYMGRQLIGEEKKDLNSDSANC